VKWLLTTRWGTLYEVIIVNMLVRRIQSSKLLPWVVGSWFELLGWMRLHYLSAHLNTTYWVPRTVYNHHFQWWLRPLLMCQSSYAPLQPVILLLVKFFILRGLVPIILNIHKKHIKCKSPLSDFFKFYLSFNTKSEPLQQRNDDLCVTSQLYQQLHLTLSRPLRPVWKQTGTSSF
jgi:hypothetical protein